MKKILILVFCCFHYAVWAQSGNDSIQFFGEKHFKNIRQLTFGGDNAEAYFSYDGKYLVYQRTDVLNNIPCDQIWMGKLPEKENDVFQPRLVSTGTGRTTCAFFHPDGKHVYYASTHLGNTGCPPVPDRSKYGNRYVWPIYADFDIFMADTSGKKIRRITNTPGYDAEATISPKGDRMIFTSMRDGDLELYSMNLKGKQVKRLTHTAGYDGGAWFSPDGNYIIWRASRPSTEQELKEYKELLSEGLVMPTKMELWMARADGTEARQLTHLGQANWAPNFAGSSDKVVFCSNHEYKRGFPFNMYLLHTQTGAIEKISRDKGFDAFPMLSPDGKKLVFCSNRNNGGTRDTNIFIADWVD